MVKFLAGEFHLYLAISNSPLDSIFGHLVCFHLSIFKHSKSGFFFIGGLQISVLLEDVICLLKNRQFFFDLKAVKAKNLSDLTLLNPIPSDQVEIIKGCCCIFCGS